MYHWAFVLLSLYLTIFHLYIRTNGKTAMESLISVFTVYCIHISLHLQIFFFFFFFFPVFRILNGTCTELFFSWNCILRKENIFAYLFPGTFLGWQLQNKLFNKPGLLTGSSGQIFQINLNYCSSAFFHLSASWTLFWPWMPDKLCHEKIYVSYDILVSPPTPNPQPPLQRPSLGPAYLPSLIRDLVSFVRHRLWSGCEGDRLFRGSDSCTYSAYRFFTTMHMVLILVHCSFFPFYWSRRQGGGVGGGGLIRKITLITNFWLNIYYCSQPACPQPACPQPACPQNSDSIILGHLILVHFTACSCV